MVTPQSVPPIEGISNDIEGMVSDEDSHMEHERQFSYFYPFLNFPCPPLQLLRFMADVYATITPRV